MKTFLVFLSVLIAGLTSCEKYIEYQSIIDNRSSDTISVHFQGTTAYIQQTDTVIVPPYTKTVYYKFTGRTIPARNRICNPQISGNETTITTSSGRRLIKDIANKNNWICETNDDNSFWNQIFSINENDLH